ncbi:hypothetical protein M9Y10_029384 [Tritrichomonas musculus]|uniref:Haloacid dehalogenase-like hydrolase family protein n=1 Tax=Tritrichomonas musculus TaxID=1915356 RepID=A0ABR2KN37_9EUKA
MSQKNILITWDIDGTLIIGKSTSRDHLEAFHLACENLFGKCDEPEKFLGHSIDGMMDSMILSEMIEKLGFEANEENLCKGQKMMEEIFIKNCQDTPEVPVGIADTLKELSKYPNVTCAIASGNYEKIAWRKLELGGIAQYFPDKIGGLGVVKDRKDALLLARKIAEEKKGLKFDIIMHVGDTPNDIIAAQKAGAIPFGVRTGRVHYPNYPTPSYVFDNIIVGHDQFMKLLELE